MSTTQVGTRCTKCEKPLRVEPELLGKTVRCPGCRKTFVVSSVSFSDPAAASRAERSVEAYGTRMNSADNAETFGGVKAASSVAAPPPSGKLGRFELHEVLGRGGFGVVYRAYDPLLDRQVALKVPIFASTDDKRARRFLNEAKASAKLRNPNIVAVYESGQVDGKLYMAAEYIRGETLAEAVKKARPSLEQAVAWVREIAGALAFAHEQGIVHRDIKPQNVMIDAAGRPQIMDFGLAKRLDQDSKMTSEGALLGTPAYMSPEQARGDVEKVGPDSDQYSLGAVLYELITGTKPFDGPPAVVIAKTIAQEPKPPSQVNPEIPRDLEAVCLKAMDKDPARRFVSVGAFGRDLANWEIGEAVEARPLGRRQRFERWRRRSPGIARLTLVVGALLVLCASGSVAGALILSRSSWQREAALASAQVETRQAAEETDRAEQAARRAVEGMKHAEAETRRAEAAWTANEKALAALQAAKDGRTLTEEELAGVAKARQSTARNSMDAKSLQRIFGGVPHGSQAGPADSPAQNTAAAAGGSEANPRTLKGHTDSVFSVAFSPDGTRIASGSQETVKLWDAVTGKEFLTLQRHGAVRSGVAFSPDGMQIASGSQNTVKLWDAVTGKETRTLKGHTGYVTSVAFSPDGDRIASGSDDMSVRLWDAVTGKQSLILKGHRTFLSGVAFSPDGMQIASGHSDWTVKLWNPVTDSVTRTLKGHTNPITGVAFSPDGDRIASGSDDRTVKVWNAATGKVTRTLSGHTNSVSSVAFSPDGERIASGSNDSTVKVWNAATGGVTLTLKGHTSSVTSVAFSPDGTKIASASLDRTVKLWELRGASTGPHSETPELK